MSPNKEGMQRAITHFLRPASHCVVVHLGQERILPCRFSDMSTGDRQFVHTSDVEDVVTQLFLFVVLGRHMEVARMHPRVIVLTQAGT